MVTRQKKKDPWNKTPRSAVKTWSHAAPKYSEKQIIVRAYCFGSATSDVRQKYPGVL